MNAAQIDLELKAHSRDTGIPQEELHRMCTRAGLELLKKGELKVKMAPNLRDGLSDEQIPASPEKANARIDPKFKQVLLPAIYVDFVEELMESVDIQDGIGLFNEVIENWVKDTIRQSRIYEDGLIILEGIAEEFLVNWQHEDKALAAKKMFAVIQRYKPSLLTAGNS